MSVEERHDLVRGEAQCGDSRAWETIGLVAYLDDKLAGWCAVDRRDVCRRLRGSSVLWLGRDERKDDDEAWAVACLIVWSGFRGRGLTYPMVAAAVDYARARGATAIEGHPMLTGGLVV